jgi:hypothetical protein
MENLVTPVKRGQHTSPKVNRANRETPPSLDTIQLTAEDITSNDLPVALEDLPFPVDAKRHNTMIVKAKDKLPELPKFYGNPNHPHVSRKNTLESRENVYTVKK